MKKSRKKRIRKKLTIEEFIELVKDKSATPEAIAAFGVRCKEREKRFEEEARRRRPDAEFMNRQYTI